MSSPSDALARVPYVAASLERANTKSAAPSDASVERRRRPTDDDDDDDDARARLLACVRTAARVAEAVTRNALMRARVSDVSERARTSANERATRRDAC